MRGVPTNVADPAVGRAVVDLRRRADLLDRSLAQHRDLVGHRHRLDLVVGDVQERPAQRAVDAGELGAHLDAQLEVEVRQRLVHQERARVAHQRAPERDALHLAARQLRRLALEQLLDVQQLGDALDLRVDLGLGQLARPQRRGDVLRRRLLRVQRVALEHHRQIALGGRGAASRRSRSGARVPVSGFSSPAITRSVVVLPAPDGPSSTKNAPSGMSSSRSSSAWTSPNDFEIPCATIARGHRLTSLLGLRGRTRAARRPRWRTDTTCSSAKRAVGGIRTCSRPASVSTT